MAKKKVHVPKIVIEREYIVPLRKEWLKVPEYKRANKATKALKQFLAQHMKVYDRHLRKIKIEQDLNNEIRFRGMKKPPAKIKVNAKKYDDGIVRVELVNIPVHVKFERLREEKKKAKLEKKVKVKEEKKVEPGVEELAEDRAEPPTKEEAEEAEEKQEASKEEHLELAKQQAKVMKHTSKEKPVTIKRKALSR